MTYVLKFQSRVGNLVEHHEEEGKFNDWTEAYRFFHSRLRDLWRQGKELSYCSFFIKDEPEQQAVISERSFLVL